MKTYKQLPIPEDTAWERSRWKRFLPIWLKQFYQGVKNIFVWMPTIYKDKHWDHSYIYEILQKKLELQRKELVTANRHLDIDRDNKYLTLCINLIERLKDGYYEIEYFEYKKSKMRFEPVDPNNEKLGFTMESDLLWENYDGFLNKYKRQYRLHLNKFPENIDDKGRCCRYIAQANHNRCKKLLFKIIEEQIEHWWD